jgi:hypothetical protein
MGFYTFSGPVGCKETAIAFYFDLLSNNEYTICYRRNNERLFQGWIEILKDADRNKVIEEMSFMELYYKLDKLLSSGCTLINGKGSFPTAGRCFFMKIYLNLRFACVL